MTVTKQLALVLVKEIVETKRKQHQFPDYALYSEVRNRVYQSLNELVHDGVLAYCQVSVNKTPAFQLKDSSSQSDALHLNNQTIAKNG